MRIGIARKAGICQLAAARLADDGNDAMSVPASISRPAARREGGVREGGRNQSSSIAMARNEK